MNDMRLDSARWAPLRRIRPTPVVILILVLTVASVVFMRPAAEREYTLYFSDATKLHPGDKVSVLDVEVGRVLSVDPEIDRVRVRIAVDADQPLPADVRATIVTPTLISVRHIELSPVYDGGAVLSEDEAIPVSRTAAPVEWHEVQTQISRLASALGPDGANSDGALGDLLTSAAANLDGEGEQLGRTLASMSEALQTLSDNRGEIFATVRNLDVFVQALESSDETVRLFNEQLATVSSQFAEDGDALSDAVAALGGALEDIESFVTENGESLVSTLDNLQPFTRELVGHRQHLADILQSAPTALSNYYNIYYPDARAMTGTFVAQNLDSPAVFICSSLYSLGGTPSDCEALLEPVAQFLDIPVSPIGINPIQRDGGSGAGDAGDADELVPLPEPSGTRDIDRLGRLMLGELP